MVGNTIPRQAERPQQTVRSMDEFRAQLQRERLAAEKEVADAPPERRMHFGACSLVPDAKSGFGQIESSKHHPWVVTQSRAPGRLPCVFICPRTSKEHAPDPSIFFTEADLLPRLDKPGYFLLRLGRSFPSIRFCDFEHVGILPDDCCTRLQAALEAYRHSRAAHIARLSME
jgi:hypothetical protein